MKRSKRKQVTMMLIGVVAVLVSTAGYGGEQQPTNLSKHNDNTQEIAVTIKRIPCIVLPKVLGSLPPVYQLQSDDMFPGCEAKLSMQSKRGVPVIILLFPRWSLVLRSYLLGPYDGWGSWEFCSEKSAGANNALQCTVILSQIDRDTRIRVRFSTQNISEEESGCVSTLIKSVRDQLNSVPNKGIAYRVLKCFDPDFKNSLSNEDNIRLAFNYLGQFNLQTNGKFFFELSDDIERRDVSPNNKNPYFLTIKALVINREMKISFLYSKKHYKNKTIYDWAKKYREVLIVFAELAHEFSQSEPSLKSLVQTFF